METQPADRLYNSFVAKPVSGYGAYINREELGAGCALEDEKSIPPPDWNSDLVVFEHIGLRSGGTRYHDPGRSSRWVS